MTEAVPFLTFQPRRTGSAADAMALYASLFADGRILLDERWNADEQGTKGTVRIAEFIVAGQKFRCSDSPPLDHEWSFTPAVSVWVNCDSTDEQQRVFAALAEDGTQLMPLDDYGFGPFGWVEDRYGVSWQLAATA